MAQLHSFTHDSTAQLILYCCRRQTTGTRRAGSFLTLPVKQNGAHPTVDPIDAVDQL